MSQTTAEVATSSAKLGFMKFVVADLPAMVDFYGRILGLTVAQTIENEQMTEKILRRPGETPGFSLVLYHHKDGREIRIGNGHGPLGLYVRDVDAVCVHATAHGAQIQTPPYDIGPTRVAYVLDPEGRELELISVRR